MGEVQKDKHRDLSAMSVTSRYTHAPQASSFGGYLGSNNLIAPNLENSQNSLLTADSVNTVNAESSLKLNCSRDKTSNLKKFQSDPS